MARDVDAPLAFRLRRSSQLSLAMLLLATEPIKQNIRDDGRDDERGRGRPAIAGREKFEAAYPRSRDDGALEMMEEGANFGWRVVLSSEVYIRGRWGPLNEQLSRGELATKTTMAPQRRDERDVNSFKFPNRGCDRTRWRILLPLSLAFSNQDFVSQMGQSPL